MNKISRRSFLGAMASVSVLPSGVLAQAGKPGANGRLQIAGIGIGGMGQNNLQAIANHGHDISALCDVDSAYSAGVRARYPKAPFYTDYREMLEKEKNLDGVMIATPDHTHALIAAAAIKAGKHVFVQKPLCHDISECRELMRLAKEHKVITQMGIQGHASGGHYLINEWIKAGAIGELESIDAWCDLSYYPFGQQGWSTLLSKKPEKGLPVPETLNWDLFLGPAPVREYHPTYHPGRWRAWWDFGNGMMGDRGAHTLDSVFSVLGERMPHSIEATSCGLNNDIHPLSSIITFKFAANENFKPIKLTWYEGTRPPRPEQLPAGRNMPREGGVIFKGSKAILMCGVYGDSPRILPETEMRAFRRPPQTLERPKGGIEGDWLSGVIENRQACANFDYSARLTELTLLGNLAKRVDNVIHWDEAAMRVTNNDAANQYVTGARREGFEL